jgi:hypothetical protein
MKIPSLETFKEYNMLCKVCNKIKILAADYYLLKLVIQLEEMGIRPYFYTMGVYMNTMSRALMHYQIKRNSRRGYIEICDTFIGKNKATVKVYRVTQSGYQVMELVERTFKYNLERQRKKRNKLAMTNTSIIGTKEERELEVVF